MACDAQISESERLQASAADYDADSSCKESCVVVRRLRKPHREPSMGELQAVFRRSGQYELAHQSVLEFRG